MQILQGGDLAEGELAQGLDAIGRNAKAQQHIIEDLLDMSRILSGKVRLDVQKIELGTVLEAALETGLKLDSGLACCFNRYVRLQ